MTLEPDAMKPESWAVYGGRPHAPGAPLNAPMVPASTFTAGTGRHYARGEATEGWEAFEALIGGWEGGRALAFASGMGACAAALSIMPPGGHLVLGDDGYQGVAGLAELGAREHGWQVERLPVADARWLERTATADVVWVESPSNPLLEVADVPAICAAPRGEKTTVVVDSTFATPLGQQPLALGADVVVHSATKFIGGHSDLLLGVAVASDPALVSRLEGHRTLAGATPGTLECFLALRGARTLPLRLKAATASARELAGRLEDEAAVTRVRYPGFGALVSFELADGDAADRACAAVRLIRHTTSLGSVETTMERRALNPGQEHIPAGLVRMSVGCEDVDDLWADLGAAIRS